MATRTWLDQSGDWESTSNWSGGSVPVTGDDIYILNGTQNITTNMDQTGVDPAKVIVGPNFRGTVGTPSSPIEFGTIAYLSYNGKGCKSFNIDPTAMTKGIVMGTYAGLPASFYLQSGAATTFIVNGGMGVRIGGATVTTFVQAPDSDMTAREVNTVIDASATVTTARILGGNLWSFPAITNVEMKAGHYYHQDGNITNLDLDGGTFEFNAEGHTITNAKLFGGYCDCSKNTAAKTLGGTLLELYPRATLNANNGAYSITLGTIVTFGVPNIIVEPGRSVTVAT